MFMIKSPAYLALTDLLGLFLKADVDGVVSQALYNTGISDAFDAALLGGLQAIGANGRQDIKFRYGAGIPQALEEQLEPEEPASQTSTDQTEASKNGDSAVTKMPRALVVVSGGVASSVHDEGVDVEVFDWDNYNADPQRSGGVPLRFADLALPFDIPLEKLSAEV